jgi:hypothetical protein
VCCQQIKCSAARGGVGSGADIPEPVSGANIRVGMRVARGPDWDYGSQDANGPGTVLGFAKSDGTAGRHRRDRSWMGVRALG